MDCCWFRVSPCSGRRDRGEAAHALLPPMMHDRGERGTHAPHPVVFLILILPFGVMSGYLTVTIVYLLTQAGVPVDESAALVAMSYIPHSWKFFWAPLVDTTLSRKTWYLLATTVSGLGIYATGAIP